MPLSRKAIKSIAVIGLNADSRVALAKEGEKEVSISLPAEAFTIVDDEGQRRVDGRRFRIYAGFGQPDERTRTPTGHPCMVMDALIYMKICSLDSSWGWTRSRWG